MKRSRASRPTNSLAIQTEGAFANQAQRLEAIVRLLDAAKVEAVVAALSVKVFNASLAKGSGDGA